MFAYLVPKSIGNVGNFFGFYENKEVTLIRIYNAGSVSEMYENVTLISSFKLRVIIVGYLNANAKTPVALTGEGRLSDSKVTL